MIDPTEEKKKIECFRQKVQARIEKLKNNPCACWLCRKETNHWIVLMPENGPGDLGLGCNTSGMTRIAFVPVCEEHDLEDIDIKEQLVKVLKIKIQTLSN